MKKANDISSVFNLYLNVTNWKVSVLWEIWNQIILMTSYKSKTWSINGKKWSVLELYIIT